MSNANARSVSVLIVDDDEDIRSNMQDILDDLGYETTVAADGNSAMQVLRENSFDIALLDYCMPGMNGAELSSHIRQVSPKTVTIMVTAFAGSDGASRARSAGAWRVLDKPVAIQALLDLMQTAANEPIVLVVDDDVDFCDNLWELLREAGFRVTLANTEEQALATARSEHWDVAIIDLVLGKGDGRNVIREIAGQGHTSRIIVVSGRLESLQDLDPECVRVKKPIDVGSLLELIQATVSRI